MARRSGMNLVRHPRRRTSWGFGPGSVSATQVSATGESFLGSAVAPTTEGLVLTRLRGNCSAYLETAAAAKDGFHCAIGVAIVPDEGVAAGIGSVPTPLTDEDWDGWLYHRHFDLHVAAAAAIDSFQSSIQFEVDSKAQRKFEAGNSIYAAIDVFEVGTAVMQVFFDCRVLVKLP